MSTHTSSPEAAEVQVLVMDRFNRQYPLRGRVGQPLLSLMTEQHVPRDAVIAYIDGAAVDEEDVVLSGGMKVELRMVRAYQLPEFDRMLGIWPTEGQAGAAEEPAKERVLYTKRHLWFNDSGICELRRRRFTREDIVPWVEQTFTQGILSKQMFKPGEKVMLALSGGRDSVALLYLLHRCKADLPPIELLSCTVESLAAGPLERQVAREIADKAGVKAYGLITDKDLEDAFHLKVPFRKAMDAIYDRYGRSKSLYINHHFLRTGCEHHMRKVGVTTLCMGLHTEDLLAGILWGTVLGWPFGESPARKSWGPYSQVYPLWPISKKELTLYLEIVGPPKHSSQGAPPDVDRGDHNRDLNYFLADSIQTLWPGFALHLFDGMERRFAREGTVIRHQQCPNCEGFFIPERAGSGLNALCHACEVLGELELIPRRAG